jgi:hypothetical protein
MNDAEGCHAVEVSLEREERKSEREGASERASERAKERDTWPMPRKAATPSR